jgi:hypothetical protein
MFASVTSTPYDFATYRDINEPLTPDDVVFVVGGRHVGNQLHVLKDCGLGLAEECSHSIEDWNAIGVDGS